MKVGDLVKFSKKGDLNPEAYDLTGVIISIDEVPWKSGHAVEVFWIAGRPGYQKLWSYVQDLEVINA